MPLCCPWCFFLFATTRVGNDVDVGGVATGDVVVATSTYIHTAGIGHDTITDTADGLTVIDAVIAVERIAIHGFTSGVDSGDANTD